MQVPVARVNSSRAINKKLSRGGGTHLAGGTYTQTHGTITQSQLTRLHHNQ